MCPASTSNATASTSHAASKVLVTCTGSAIVGAAAAEFGVVVVAERPGR